MNNELNTPTVTTENFIEYEFSAEDLDSKDTVIDTVLFNEKANLPKAFDKYKAKHPIMSLSGNTWEINGWEPTGFRMEIRTIRTITSARLDEFAKKEYPQMSQE